MPGCVLRAVGVGFEPEGFLKQSALIPCNIFHKGDRRSSSDNWHTSGITVIVSKADEVSQQIKDSIEFLKNNEEELVRLRECEGLELIELDFGINRKDVFVQSIMIPAKLISLVAELRMGIEVSIYPETRRVETLEEDA